MFHLNLAFCCAPSLGTFGVTYKKYALKAGLFDKQMPFARESFKKDLFALLSERKKVGTLGVKLLRVLETGGQSN